MDEVQGHCVCDEAPIGRALYRPLRDWGFARFPRTVSLRRMTTLVLATRNAHKVEEIRAILGPRYRLLSLADFVEAPALVEDQTTFAKNAAKKASSLARWFQNVRELDFRVPDPHAFVLADDSGLEVDTLNGAPGVHSARFAAQEKSNAGTSSTPPSKNTPDTANNAKLLRLLKDVPMEKRTARFRCVLSLVRIKPPQGALSGQLFEGVCDGRIQFEPKGLGGFGYDPLFVPLGYNQSFGELGPAVKNNLSHRAKALGKLKSYFENLRL
jgi:XTP/dITP diphosphohydrolase